MYRLDRCPCCGGAALRAIPAVIAPFVRERALRGGSLIGALLDCQECGFRFFRDRYDEDEITALYAGYRDAEYLRQRRAHEFWYTRSMNAKIGGPLEMKRRVQRLEEFLGTCGIFPAATRVLDWGGDRGQFIPGQFAERFVYDISGVEPIPGVTALSADQVTARTFDVVLLAHVLEHASDPIALLESVLKIPSAYLYVEVPFEPVRLRKSLTSTAYARWVDAVATSAIYPMVAFASIGFRIVFGRLPPLGILQQHEHLNFFSESTLRRILERVGCRIVAAVAYRKHGERGPVEALGVLVTANRAAS